MSRLRKAPIKRKTNEVNIEGEFIIDGTGQAKVNTGFEPLNHLLTLFAFHGLFDLEIKADGDLQHHILEDIGIALGKTFKQALGEKQGINRYGCFTVDISGRPSLIGRISCAPLDEVNLKLENHTFDNTNFTFKYAEEFLESFLQHAGISLVYIIKSGQGTLHHILEALFKAMGKALDQATQIDPRRKGVPSTKGIID